MSDEVLQAHILSDQKSIQMGSLTALIMWMEPAFAQDYKNQSTMCGQKQVQPGISFINHFLLDQNEKASEIWWNFFVRNKKEH